MSASVSCAWLQPVVSVMQALLPDAWPDMLRILAGFLCPFRAMMQRQQQEAMAAAAAGAAAAAAGSSTEAAVPLRMPRGAAAPSTPHGAGLGPARSFNRLVAASVGLQALHVLCFDAHMLTRACFSGGVRYCDFLKLNPLGAEPVL